MLEKLGDIIFTKSFTKLETVSHCFATVFRSYLYNILSVLTLCLISLTSEADSRNWDVDFPNVLPKKPTVVFTIGMSGSGKSTWANRMVKNGWLRIDSDELNIEILKNLRLAGTIADEIGSIPDERNSHHLYMLRRRGQDKATQLVDNTITKKQSFIYDH